MGIADSNDSFDERKERAKEFNEPALQQVKNWCDISKVSFEAGNEFELLSNAIINMLKLANR